MKLLKISVIVIGFLIYTGIARAQAQQLAVNPKPMEQLAFSLYHRLVQADTNLFFSPYSISTALAMCYGGAEGNTKTQMAKTLFYPASQQSTGMIYKGIEQAIDEIEKSRNVELTTANDIWIHSSFAVVSTFRQYLEQYFQAYFASLDFVNNEPAARAAINNRVSEVTKGRISAIIPPGVITPLTRLILTNAIYFKGSWIKPFPEKKTSLETFYTNHEKQVTARLMYKQEDVLYYEDDKFQAIRLDYKGNNLGMIIILPNKNLSLEEIEPSLDPSFISTFPSYASINTVNIRIPRFVSRSNFELREPLSALGMSDAFDNKADFSGISLNENLKISNVIHQAFIEVNEEGTEAAAATAVVMVAKSLAIPKPVKEFRADRPFFYAIVDNKDGMILFIGRLINPEA